MADETRRIGGGVGSAGGMERPAGRRSPFDPPRGEAPPRVPPRPDLFDPRDVEAALEKLARLLAEDDVGRPQAVARRGYYFDVLV